MATIVFLGDFADRGDSGVEIIECLIDLKTCTDVWILKGNHEDYYPDGEPKFHPCSLVGEAVIKRGDWHTYFTRTLKPFFDSLELSALVNNEILLVHGGISNKISCIGDLETPRTDIADDILWSDPAVYFSGEQLNQRGKGVEFGKDVVDSVMQKLGLKFIIRSHEPARVKSGPLTLFDKLVTISSTSIYGGRPHYLEVDFDNGDISMKTVFVDG